MVSTEQLIRQLSHGVQPVRAVSSPFELFIKWLVVSLIYLSSMLLFFHLRPDIADKFSSPLFVAELVMLALLVITSSLSAVFLSFPDMCQKRWLVFTPIFAIMLFVGTLVVEYISDSALVIEPSHGIKCMLCISMFALFPAFLMFMLLRGQATTHYYTVGAVSLLAATSIGAITLRLSENTDSMLHLVKWHYTPIIAFGILGLWLGKRFFKW